MQPIEYKHVAFSYDESKPLLTDVNFVVPGGKMYAIVGSSGSGKSTVVNMIPRLYDVLDGSVTIAGVDVRDFDLKYLRQCIGVVTQESYLFNGTILENLRYAKEDATMEEIEAACRIANIHDFISKQPDGYNTHVGNRGLKLSGGEKQRISLARVVLKNPKILILDEATSALDSISENAIQDALENMMKDRTSIVIAHRLSTILKADCILVVKDGVISEQGTHEELLALGSTYSDLFKTQFSQAIDYDSESKLNIDALSTSHQVRHIAKEDISDVYVLCKSNQKYYEYMNDAPTVESLTEIISRVPDGAEQCNKYFVGFYEQNQLISVLELITGYPENNDAFIGWFMVAGHLQRQGIGSQIFADVRAAMTAQGYDYLSLSSEKENEEAISFWKAQGFKAVTEDKKRISFAREI